MALREASEEDRDRILAWRNHPRVREASLTAHVIEADEHALWWSIVRSDPDRHLLVYDHLSAEGPGTVPAGVVVLAREEPELAAWSFYLDVAGLAPDELLRAWVGIERDSIAYAFDELGVERIEGEVLATNAAVLALHRRFGFGVADRYERDIDGTATPVLRVRLRAGDQLTGVGVRRA